MAKRLYVGNLPYSVRDERLREAFSAFGSVSDAVVMLERGSTRSKGFGFVEMPNDDEALKAIQGLHDKELEGRRLVVNEARPLEDRPPRSDRGDRGGDRRGGGGGDRRGGGYGGGGYGGGGGGYYGGGNDRYRDDR